MGCDIHAYMEAKIGGTWLYLGRLVNHRNYDVFGRLTKNHPRARGEEDEGMFEEADALWSDATEELQKEWKGWEGDGHTLTLIDSHEDLQMFCDRFDKYQEDWDGSQSMWTEAGFVVHWEEVAMKLMHSGVVEEVRIAIWYDN